MIPKIIFILCLLFGFSIAQIYQIGIGSGSTFIVGQEYYTDELESIAFQDYFGSPYTVTYASGLNFGAEYNLNIIFRIIFNNLPFNVVSEVGFNSFTGRGSMRLIPSPASSFLPPPLKAESRCNLINLSLGSEYKLRESGLVPFVSGNILINYLGDIEIQPVNHFSSYKYKLSDGGFRYGFAIGIGIEHQLYRNLLITLSSQYAIYNLIGRESAEKQLNAVKTGINIMYQLGRSK